MNQEKIGLFIAKCRKNKNLTQQQLANKIGVSDRTISNYENGRRLPDYSIIEKLCDELDISINELLAGERLEDESYRLKSDANLKDIFKNKEYQDAYNRKVKRLDFVISVTMIIILIIYSTFKNSSKYNYLYVIFILIIIVDKLVIHKLFKDTENIIEESVYGEIIFKKELWFIKINKSLFRVNSLDAATFPTLIRYKYVVNNNEYIKYKLVTWSVKLNEMIIVTYISTKPQKVLMVKRKET